LSILIDIRSEINGIKHVGWSFEKAANLYSARYQEVFYKKKGENIHRIGFNRMGQKKDLLGVEFIGVRSRYFCVAILPQDVNYEYIIHKTHKNKIDILTPVFKGKNLFNVFIGPQNIHIFEKIGLKDVINFGFFHGFSMLLLKALEGVFSLTKNWGLSIIIITLLINFILFPLTKKSTKSMKDIQKIQGKVEELKIKHKDNPQKLNKEIMELYKKHKINPLSGCLPWLFQIPLFISFYQVLMRFVSIKGAGFLWIKDLSQPDRFPLPFFLPKIGNTVNILPLFMVVIMFLQQKITAKNTSPSQNTEQQKIFMWFFPVFMGFIFYKFPSALVLYWLTNSIIMFFYQYKTLKITEKEV